MVAINFNTEQGNYQGFAGSVSLAIASFVTLSGDFAFEKTGTGTETKLLVGAAHINAFLGTEDQTMGVRVTDANRAW
jgi:hypothetical protein